MAWFEGTIAGLDFRVAELEESQDDLIAMLARGLELFSGDDATIEKLRAENDRLREIERLARDVAYCPNVLDGWCGTCARCKLRAALETGEGT